MIINNSKNKISHIDNTKCNQCITTNKCIHKSRKKFINRCLPFNNFDESKKNILNFDKTSYIYFYKKNIATYYLKKDFSIKLIKPPAPLFSNINILTEEILQTVFNIDDIEIPCYYLFSNYTHVFNIFTTYYKLFLNNIKNNIKLELDNLNKELDDIKEKHTYINKLLFIKSTEYKNLNANINKIKLKLKTSSNTFEQYELDILQNELDILQNELDILLNTPKYTKGIKELNDLNIQKIVVEEKIRNIKKEQSILEKSINNIFQIDDNNNNFVKISYMFNIFNISLLCEKYFIIRYVYKLCIYIIFSIRII